MGACVACCGCGRCMKWVRNLETKCTRCGIELGDKKDVCPQCGMIQAKPPGIRVDVVVPSQRAMASEADADSALPKKASKHQLSSPTGGRYG